MREKFKSREKLDFNSTILCSFLTINLNNNSCGYCAPTDALFPLSRGAVPLLPSYRAHLLTFARRRDRLPAISDNPGFMLALKKGKYRCFCCFDTWQISPAVAVINPYNYSPPAGQVRGLGGVFGSETRPLVLPPPPPPLPSNPPVCAKSVEKSLNKKKNKNVQECLIWLQPI